MKIAHPEVAFREAAEEACRNIGTMVEKWVCPPRGCWPGQGGEGVPTAELWAASLPVPSLSPRPVEGWHGDLLSGLL